MSARELKKLTQQALPRLGSKRGEAPPPPKKAGKKAAVEGDASFTPTYQGAQYWYHKMKRDHEKKKQRALNRILRAIERGRPNAFHFEHLPRGCPKGTLHLRFVDGTDDDAFCRDLIPFTTAPPTKRDNTSPMPNEFDATFDRLMRELAPTSSLPKRRPSLEDENDDDIVGRL